MQAEAALESLTPNTRSKFRFLYWGGAVAALIAGLVPIASTPLLGDDAVVLVTGARALRIDGSLLGYISETVAVSTSGNHVLPLGGLITSLAVAFTVALGDAGVGSLTAWGGIRLALVVAALLSAAWAAAQLMAPGDAVAQKRQRSDLVFQIFVLSGAVFLASMQIHGLWSQDPLLAYSLASWLTPTMVFATFGVLIRSLWAERPVGWWLLALALSLAGPFVYEPFVVGLLATIPVLVLCFREARSLVRIRARRLVTLSIVGLSTVAFLAAQLWRLEQGTDYSGTTGGFAQMVLPVWQTAVLGYLPLTNTQLTLSLARDYGSSVGLVVWIAAMITVLVLLWHFGRNSSLGRSWPPIGLFSLFCLLFALGAAGLIALSEKYQLEIGREIGRTYLFYGIGLLGIATTAALLGQLLPAHRTVVLLGVLCLLLPLGTVQWIINSRQMNAIEDLSGWTRNISLALDTRLPSTALCSLDDALNDPSVPAFYREAITADLSQLYWGTEMSSLCPENQSQMLIAN